MIAIDTERFTKLREKAGKSKTAVAKALGVSVSHISEFESGHKGISNDLMARLLDLYGYELEIYAVQRKGRSKLSHRLL